MRLAVASLLLVALAAGCGDEPSQPKPQPQPYQPEPIDLDLPEIGAAQTDPDPDPDPDPSLPTLEEDDYLPLPAPETTELLQWDFGDGKRHPFTFTQTIDQIITSKAGDTHSETRTHGRNRGLFHFVAWKNNLAKLHIQIATIDTSINGKSVPREQLAQLKPTRFECTLKNDGTLTAPPTTLSESGDARVYLDALLPITTGEKKAADGFARTKITGHFKVGRYECTRLETEFEYSPTSESGRSVLRGRTVGYFAHKEGFLVRAKTAAALSSRTRLTGEDNIPIDHTLETRTTFQLKRNEAQ